VERGKMNLLYMNRKEIFSISGNDFVI
jgi:hypothetical protein